MDAELAKVLIQGGLAGVCIGLMYLLLKKDADHRAQIEGMVSVKVYEDVCKRSDRQADLLGDLSKSVAILVDRRESPR